tara:strand:+ start:142 stop:564 length:423 start_codon:yes stop_codon:yes gene_type:complete
MFRAFRELSEGVRGMVIALDGLTRSQAEDLELRKASGDIEERVSALELSRALWEADVEAEFKKAESSRQAAMNAESRTRTMKRSYEKYADPFLEDEPEEVIANRGVLPQQYVENGEAEGVPPVHMGVEDKKQTLMRAKFL